MKNTFAKKFIVFLFSLFVVFSSVPNISANTSILGKDTTRTYTLNQNYIVVEETRVFRFLQNGYRFNAESTELFTIFLPSQTDSLYEDRKKETIDSITIKDGSGKGLAYTEENIDTNQNLFIAVPLANVTEIGGTYSISISYKSFGLTSKIGEVTDIYVPGYPKEYSFVDEKQTETVNTKVILPKDYSATNFVTPFAEEQILENTREFTIPQQNIIGQTTWIQLGREQYFRFNIKQTIPKSSNIPFVYNTYTLPLPRDIQTGSNVQKVFFSKFSIEPSKIFLDRDLNLMAEFRVPTFLETTLEIGGYAVLTQDPEFRIESGGTLDSIEPGLVQNYTQSATYWETTSPEIILAAKEIADLSNSTDVYDRVNTTFDFVVDRIDYSFTKKYGLNERKGALATLLGSAAVCMEYSDLFIALLRAQGIPARAAFGYGFGGLDVESQSEQTINHQWAEVYIPSLAIWAPVDTTWGDFGSNILGGDLNHFYSHVASIDPETPTISSISFYGQINSLPQRETKIEIIPFADFSNNQTKTQQNLLDEYTKENNIIELSNSFATIFDFSILWFANLLNVPKVFIYIFSISFILAVIFIGIFLKKKKKISKIS